MKLLRMADLDLAGKRVLIREDLNVPVQNGVVTSDARIRAALPTLRLALEQGARVDACCRTWAGRRRASSIREFSLAPVAAKLSELLGKPVPLVQDWLDGVDVQRRHARCCARTCASTRARRRTARRWRGRWRRCAMCS